MTIFREIAYLGMKFGGEYSRLMSECRVKKIERSEKMVLAAKKLEFRVTII